MFRAASIGIALLAWTVVTSTSPTHAAVPPSDGWVTDLAGFLTPKQEGSLEELMESYKRGSGHEVALLTVPNLGGRNIERYALEVGREWGIGQEDLHDGALLLVAREERKIRIEVGRGLEGTLTDSISGRIIRDVIAPEFRAGRVPEGLRAGIEAIHAAAGGDYSRLPESKSRSRRGSASSVLFVVYIVIFILVVARRRGGRGGGGAGGILPWLLLGSMSSRGSRGWRGGIGGGGGGFSGGGFGGGGGFSGGGASGGW